MSEAYSDWLRSSKSARVWLEDSMTALCQFAFIAPIHRVKHWDVNKRKRSKCWAKESECYYCNAGVRKLNEFTYGIYTEAGQKEISYLTVPVSTHTIFQRKFSNMIEGAVNPTDVVFEISRTKVPSSQGRAVMGYYIDSTETDMFVQEKFRPSLMDGDEQSFRWVVPEEIVVFLKDKNGEPMTLIDLFLLLKENFSGLSDTDLKAYAIRLIDNNVLDLRRGQEKWI